MNWGKRNARERVYRNGSAPVGSEPVPSAGQYAPNMKVVVGAGARQAFQLGRRQGGEQRTAATSSGVSMRGAARRYPCAGVASSG